MEDSAWAAQAVDLCKPKRGRKMADKGDSRIAVDRKLTELQRVVDESWERGEWELAALGTGVIRAVESSRASALEMKRRADDLSATFQALVRTHSAAAG